MVYGAAHRAHSSFSSLEASEISMVDGKDQFCRPRQERVPVVSIGASAGGIAALQAFFEALPHNVGAAFVVILHLDPDHASGLANIISARTKMPVLQVTGAET